MKSSLLILAGALVTLSSCQTQVSQQVKIIVSNETDRDAMGVVDGVSLKALLDSIGGTTDTHLIITNENGEEVRTQLFNNGIEDLLLFESSTLANGESTYLVRKGDRSASDRQASLIDLTYLSRVDSLRAAGENFSADSLVRADGYVLEGATVALQDSLGRMSYSRNWQKHRVLSNGPLLAAIQYDYDTLFVGRDSILEQRTILTQIGTPFHIVRVSYRGLTHPTNIAVGLSYHGNEDSIRTDNQQCYLAYSSPASSTDSNRNGKNATGVYLPNLKRTTLEQGHLFGLTQYTPDEAFTYYIGHGWNKGDSLYLDYLVDELKQLNMPSRTSRIEKQ